MDQIWTRLWDSGLPVVLLGIAVVTLWVTWRADAAQASVERTAASAAMTAVKEEIGKLREAIESMIGKSK